MNCIIVLNYNNYEETIQYVEEIKEFKCLDVIVIVDNASTDNSTSHLKNIENDKIHLVINDHNKGYNAGNNSGVLYAQNNYSIKNVIISNPDIKVDEANMNMIIESLEHYSLVAPIVFDRNGKIQSNCGWNLPSYLQSLANCCLITYKIQKMMGHSNFFPANNFPDIYVPVEAVSGCFFGITNEAYNQIGGFDEDVFLYGEEVLLGSRLKKLNLTSVINKHSKVIHNDHGANKEDFKKWQWHSQLIKKAHIIYLKKHLNIGKVGILIYTLFYNIGRYLNRYIIESLL